MSRYHNIYDRKLRSQARDYGWKAVPVGKIWRKSVKQAAVNKRRAQRQAAQRQRALAKRQAQLAKMRELERAAYEVEVFENRLEMLTSVHQECSEPMDWQEILQESPPEVPVRSDGFEQGARALASQYRPGFLARLFGQEAKQRAALEARVQQAREEDERQYQERLQQYQEDESEWKSDCELASRVLDGEWSAYLEAISSVQPFSDVEELGSHIRMSPRGKRTVVVILQVNSERVIPGEIKSLLKSGKLSEKKMPQGRFYELYQDYVCGCLFRVARELFALLPVDTVVVNCHGQLFDSSTGLTNQVCLLCTKMPRSVVEALNFDFLDPSDALSNFDHRMNFKKTRGFAQVEPF